METLRFLLVTTFYPPYHLGGDAVHVEYLARTLAGRGHEVHVEFAPAAYRAKRWDKPLASPSADPSIHLRPIPSSSANAQPIGAYLFGRSRSVTRFHARILEEIRPDVVHHHNISLLGRGVLEGASNATTLYTAHDYWLRCPRSDLFKYGRYPCDDPTCVRCTLASRRPPQLWRRGWRGLEGIDMALAPSRFMLRALERWTNCPIVHIPNFTPDRNPGGRVARPEDFYLYVGVLETHKGILELASAVAGRPERTNLVIVGRGAHETRLRALSRQWRTRVRVEGWLEPERLAGLYPKAKALLLPSLSLENAPLAAIEALSWGTPLLVSRRGGLEELLDDGEAGRSFEPRPEDIIASIERFEEEGLPEKLRAGARRVYEKHYRPEDYLERYMSLLDGKMDSVAAPEVARPGPESGRSPGSV